jgi:hypothetical protein
MLSSIPAIFSFRRARICLIGLYKTRLRAHIRNKKYQANLAEIKEKIAKDTAEVKASLQQEIDAFAEAIGQKILGRVV